MGHAFVLLGLITGIWSVMGAQLFNDDAPRYCGRFSKAMLTQFQVMTFDAWSSEVSRPILLAPDVDPGSAIMHATYYISYVFVASIIMANMVVAILLDKYLKATTDLARAAGDCEELVLTLWKELIPRLEHLEEVLAHHAQKEAEAALAHAAGADSSSD